MYNIFQSWSAANQTDLAQLFFTSTKLHYWVISFLSVCCRGLCGKERWCFPESASTSWWSSSLVTPSGQIVFLFILIVLKCFFSSWSCLFCLGKLSKISELSLKLGVSGWSRMACVLLIVVASKEMQLRITGFCSSLSCLNQSSPKSLLILIVNLEISQNLKSNYEWYLFWLLFS